MRCSHARRRARAGGGYCQRRLAEDWGDGPAIVGISCLFLFAHSQYLSLDAYNLGMAASLFCLSMGFGIVFAATRSLMPSVVAHALINLPMTPLWQGVCLALFVVVACLAWRRGRAAVRQVFSRASMVSCLVLALAGASWAIAARQFGALIYIAVGLVACAVVGHVIERRRNSSVATADHEAKGARVA